MHKHVQMHSSCAKTRSMNADWEDLKTVLYLVKDGSLSEAARSLGINYTTVARRISRIEADLGHTLFQRLPEGYVATEAGKNVASAAQEMELHSNGLIRSLTAAQEQLTGPLIVTAPQALVASHLAEVFQQLKSEHPLIELTVRATNDTLDLNRPEADIAIRISDTLDDTLVGQRLARQQTLSYAAPRIADEMAADPTATINWIGMPYWKSPPKASLEKYPNARVAYRFDDITALVGAAVAGLGVVRLPMFLGDAETRLVRVPMLSPQPYWDIWVLTHKDMRNAPKVAAFKKILIPFFRAHRSDFWQD